MKPKPANTEIKENRRPGRKKKKHAEGHIVTNMANPKLASKSDMDLILDGRVALPTPQNPTWIWYTGLSTADKQLYDILIKIRYGFNGSLDRDALQGAVARGWISTQKTNELTTDGQATLDSFSHHFMALRAGIPLADAIRSPYAAPNGVELRTVAISGDRSLTDSTCCFKNTVDPYLFGTLKPEETPEKLDREIQSYFSRKSGREMVNPYALQVSFLTDDPYVCMVSDSGRCVRVPLYAHDLACTIQPSCKWVAVFGSTGRLECVLAEKHYLWKLKKPPVVFGVIMPVVWDECFPEVDIN